MQRPFRLVAVDHALQESDTTVVVQLETSGVPTLVAFPQPAALILQQVVSVTSAGEVPQREIALAHLAVEHDEFAVGADELLHRCPISDAIDIGRGRRREAAGKEQSCTNDLFH